MNEEFKIQLIPLLENTKDGLAIAIDFLCEQSPILVNEILLWEGIKSGIICLIFIILMIVGMMLTRYIRPYIKKPKCKQFCDEEPIDCPVCPVLAVMGHIIPYIVLPIIVLYNNTWLQILIAPRLFLIEYVREWL